MRKRHESSGFTSPLKVHYAKHRLNPNFGSLFPPQVVLWDTASIQEQVFRKEKRGGDDDDRPEPDGTHVPVVKPSMLSSLDAGHSLPVADLHWLPGHMEIDGKGKVAASRAGETNVFGTIAPDGKVTVFLLEPFL
jgi:hypothetical protein